MSATMIAFDTLKFAKELEEAGLPDEQAEAFSRATLSVMSNLLEDQMVTKTDLKNLGKASKQDIQELNTKFQEFGSKIRQDMQKLDSKFQQDMQEFKAEVRQEIQELRVLIDNMSIKLTLRLGGLTTAAVVVLAAIIKL